MIYFELNEVENANYWKKNAFKSFDYYEGNHQMFCDELTEVNPDFCYEEIFAGAYRSSITTRVSIAGEKYVKKTMKKEKNEIQKLLDFDS